MGEIQNLFPCMSMVHKIQQVCLALEARFYKVKASVPRNKQIVLTVNQEAGVSACVAQVRGTRVGTGCGLCLREVSRTVPWPLINASANWSPPLGVLLVCHKLLCAPFGRWTSLSCVSEKNTSICLPYFNRGLKRVEGLKGIQPVIKHVYVNQVNCAQGKDSGLREREKEEEQSPSVRPLEGPPPLCHQDWPASAGCTLGSGFN